MDKPIRILHVLQRMEAGGTQALLMNYFRNIDKRKIQFDFLVEYPDKQFYDEEIKQLGGNIYYTNVRKDFNVFKFQKELKKILLENNYKIIHVHAYTIGYFVLKTAKECGIPVRIAHSHSNNMTNDYKKVLKKILQKLYLIHATDYMACSKEAGDYLFKNRKYIILKNAIDSTKFVFKKEIRIEKRKELELENNFVVGHVGRLKKEKNHFFLIDVFIKIKEQKKESKLLLIGDGEEEEKIKEYIKMNGIEKSVVLLKNRNDINELLQAMDVFIFPSLYEGLGIVAIESQAAGTPIIVSDGVPNEAIISPICKKIPLDKGIETWCKEALSISQVSLIHSNMQKYIVESGFDLNSTTKELEKFYMSKI